MARSLLTLVGITTLAVFVSQGQGQDRRGSNRRASAQLTMSGPEHKALAALVGAWTLSGEGTKNKGRAEFQSQWDGRFITEETSLVIGQVIWEWKGIYGYDRHKGKYTGVWIDSMDTNTESAEGAFDARGKVLTLKGQHEDPGTGEPATYLWRISFIDESQIKIEMVQIDNLGKESIVLALLGKKAK